MPSNTKHATKKTIEDTYQKMDPHEHVLSLPDTYVGGIEEDTHSMWVLDKSDPENYKIVSKQIKYVPGLYKIFDEIIVNARDQSIKDKTCKNIRVDINQQTGEISCMNDGEKGIPVVIHKEEKIYVPELIFGNLLTSGNYNQKGKTWGGKNGYGAKLANIFSTEFNVEVAGIYEEGSKMANKKQKFTQKYTNNMYDKQEPVITPLKDGTKSYCKISFKPDFKRFGVESLSDDVVSLFEKRVYDMAALTREDLKVYLNGKKIEINNFEQYIKMFYDRETAIAEPIYAKLNDRWRIGVLFDPDSGYRQVSYVNGICTFKGGSHEKHVLDQVVGGVAKFLNEKHKKKKLNIKNAHIKDMLTVFIESVIEDPSFNSQTKEELSSKLSSFGSRCEVNDKFIKDLVKTGLEEEVVQFAELKAMAALKKSDGKKAPTLSGIDKYDKADWAGTRKSKYCRLILTEGDSAKSYAVAGTEVIGRKKYGVFPLKGKMLNVRDAAPKQLMNNAEIMKIKRIMGLKHGKKYTNVSQLRYGGIVILTDEDYDGYHIKALLINFIHFFWPSLLKIKGFIQSFATPIIKAWKVTDKNMKNPKIFYTPSEYKTWTDKLGGSLKSKGWKVKYYKGLGTSTNKEAKEAFKDFDENIISYIWDNPNTKDMDNSDDEGEIVEEEEDDDDDDEINSSEEEDTNSVKSEYDYETDKENKNYSALMLGFSKTKAKIAARKQWIKNYDKDDIIENNETNISYYDFIHRGLIHFSNYDCIRSIPSMCDGLKPSQRKIMYVTIKKNYLNNEIKVAQLVGYVAAEAAYHHGEMSLQGAIVNMAQDYVGSNNINLLLPNGEFGNRREGGKNNASPRYIFTQLNELTPLLLRKEDNHVYTYVDDDGINVEPVSYAPIIPMVLLNGLEGIGTGFSTSVPCYNPVDLVANIKRMIDGKQPLEMIPWYRGFTGTVIKKLDKYDEIIKGTYQSIGTYEIINKNKIIITELPVGKWTDDYKSFLETLVEDDKKHPKKGQLLESMTSNCGNNSIHFTLNFLPGELQTIIKSGKILTHLKLTKTINTTNMHLYTTKSVIKKYETVSDILLGYYDYRLNMYTLRKAYYLKFLENFMNILKYKIKFIKYVISGKIVMVENKIAKEKNVIIDKLEELEFPKLSNDAYSDEEDRNYNYITGLSMFSTTPSEMKKLQDEYEKRKDEAETYKNTKVEDIWLSELDEFSKAYKKWSIEDSKKDVDEDKDRSKGKKKDKKKK